MKQRGGQRGISVDFLLLEEHDWFEIERNSYNPQGCNGLCVIGNRND